MENEASCIRYHKLLAEFTARKLPRFYQKYGSELKVHEKETPDFSQQKADDLIPPVLPIEKYLDIAASVRKRRFFEAINIGDIVEGRVTDKWADLLYIRIFSVYLGPKRWIADLKIKAECDLSECKTHTGSRRLSYSVADFDVGDKVRGLVSTVDSKDWKICISFRKSLLPDHLPFIELGAVNDIKEFEDDCDEDVGYLKHLRQIRCFANPESVNNYLTELGIDAERTCTFLDQLSYEVEADEFGEKLRERQSTKWSMDMVSSGVKFFKESKHEEAMKCFDQALQMHSTNVEALVARGALKANQNMLKSSITDFRQALEIHPSHRNGCKYLCETLVSLAKQYEKDRLWKDASRKYREVLEIDANHVEATERVHQIQMMLSQQIAVLISLPGKYSK
eukprot:Seg1850.8 transcript_id=Seg1850.8/GoldUCD/mRNA.D3Y31 product="Tetratricopeptide repeat protein 14" protein_id=Seg1850.8/GoldUCD/D3Y31